MISFEDRMALVRAGYTASQIAEFDKPQPEQPQPEQPHPEQPQPEQKQQPEQQPNPDQQPQPDFATMMQNINNSMAAMLAAMQAQNIKNANMQDSAKETPGEILAKLLNP